jgi:two-component system sensor histidine kinase CpxA
MKVTFPLSLKISLWLLLNLLLLGTVGLAYFVGPRGLGLDALVGGPAGNRLQTLADIIASETGSASAGTRDAVLARFSRAYGASLYLFQNNGRELAGPPVALPATVRSQLLMHGPQDNPARGGEFPPPELDGRPPPPDDAAEPRDRPPEGGLVHRRFGVNESGPGGYWIGFRVPFNPDDSGFALPATLLVRVDSRWGLLRLLDLQPWLLGGAGVLVCSVLFWLPLVQGITRALRELTRATERIAEGRFDTRVPARRRDELGQLGGSVNRMAAQLDVFVHGQKRFLADVAHELGSPLGRLQVATGILEERAGPGLQAAVADVREEVQLMGALVRELLAFTRAGLRAREAALAAVSLPSLVARVLAREDPGAHVQPEIPEGLEAFADAELLERALGNLVRNALRYAAGDGPVTVAAHRDGSEVVVTVTDAGPGVPPGALARLGEPFYRPEEARTRETGGAGLGLAIVKSSVEACRGRVSFRNLAPRGFAAEIRLPFPA